MKRKSYLMSNIADITHLTAIITGNQLNTVAYMCEKLLCLKEADKEELLVLAEKYIDKALYGKDTSEILPDAAQRFYEEIRPIEIFNCLNRMRGLHFTNALGLQDSPC